LADRAKWIGAEIAKVITANPGLLALPENAVLKDGGDLADLVATDSSFLQTISPEIAHPIQQAFTEAGDVVFMSVAAVIAVAFVLTFLVKEIPLRDKSGVEAAAEDAANEAKMASMH
jgi:hypothetical protein